MSESVTLPALGESVTEGTVTRWLKQVGDSVEVDEPLLEVSTDKVDTEVPSPIAGVIEEILVQEDETVEVGAALVRIGDGSASGGSEPAPQPEDARPAEQAQPAEQPQPAPPAQAPHAAPQAAPSAPAPSAPSEVPDAGSSYAGPAPEVESAAAGPAPSPPQGGTAEAPGQETDVPSSDAPLGSDRPAAQGSPNSPQSPAPTPAPAPPAAGSRPGPAPSTPAPRTPSEPTGAHAAAPYVTPIVRKLAHERGVDLNGLQGSGVGGRIRKEDVLAAVEAAQPATRPTAAPTAAKAEPSPLRGTTVKMSRLRRVVADRAVVSMQSTAQLTTVVEADVTAVARLRDRVKADFQSSTGQKLSFLPFFALAAVEALQQYPIVNATVEGDAIAYPSTENLSIAVDTERGLLTPVIRDAGGRSIADLAKQIADLASRTRENRLKPDELAGGTFTLTNTGSRGALFDTPLVFLPQVAILGTGAVVKKPAVVATADGGESIAIRSSVYLALSYDHRIVDGADAARFLVAVRRRLEDGAFEGDLGI